MFFAACQSAEQVVLIHLNWMLVSLMQTVYQTIVPAGGFHIFMKW